jgi:hypothetical protein
MGRAWVRVPKVKRDGIGERKRSLRKVSRMGRRVMESGKLSLKLQRCHWTIITETC